jgi:beta-galactosidase/beta-glucuronidase
MRIGINSNLTHGSPPTDAMMEAADDAGIMLIPESPIRGNELSRFNPGYTPQSVRNMGRHCRNHPGMARYTLTNEGGDKRGGQWPWPALIDAMLGVDDGHPLVFELNLKTEVEIQDSFLKSRIARIFGYGFSHHLQLRRSCK